MDGLGLSDGGLQRGRCRRGSADGKQDFRPRIVCYRVGLQMVVGKRELQSQYWVKNERSPSTSRRYERNITFFTFAPDPSGYAFVSNRFNPDQFARWRSTARRRNPGWTGSGGTCRRRCTRPSFRMVARRKTEISKRMRFFRQRMTGLTALSIGALQPGDCR